MEPGTDHLSVPAIASMSDRNPVSGRRRGGSAHAVCVAKSRRAAAGEKTDRQPRLAVLGQIGQRFAQDGRELESVARQAGGEGDLRVFGMAIDDEMAVGAQRVEARGESRAARGSLRGGTRQGTARRGSSRSDRDGDRLRADRPPAGRPYARRPSARASSMRGKP